MDDFEQDYIMPANVNEEEFDDEPEEVDPWLARGWSRSRNKPGNICKFIKGVGLCTVFPWANGYKFVAGGNFSDVYATQEEAQLAAKSLWR